MCDDPDIGHMDLDGASLSRGYSPGRSIDLVLKSIDGLDAIAIADTLEVDVLGLGVRKPAELGRFDIDAMVEVEIE